MFLDRMSNGREIKEIVWMVDFLMIHLPRVRWSMDMAEVSHSAHAQDRIIYHRQRLPRPSPIHSISSRNLTHIITNCNHWKWKKVEKILKVFIIVYMKTFFAESRYNKEENQTQGKNCELSVYRAPKRKIHSWKNLDGCVASSSALSVFFPNTLQPDSFRRQRLAPLSLTTVRLEALHNCRRRLLRRLLCVFTFYTFHLFMAKVFDVEFFSSLLFSAAHTFFFSFFWVKNLFGQKDSKKKFAHREHVQGLENRFPPKTDRKKYLPNPVGYGGGSRENILILFTLQTELLSWNDMMMIIFFYSNLPFELTCVRVHLNQVDLKSYQLTFSSNIRRHSDDFSINICTRREACCLGRGRENSHIASKISAECSTSNSAYFVVHVTRREGRVWR